VVHGDFAPAADKAHLLYYQPAQHGTLLEACEFDLPLAGAALLGHDAGILLEEQSLRALLAILADPRKRDRLVLHMTRFAGTESEIATRLLDQFELGLQMKKIPAA